MSSFVRDALRCVHAAERLQTLRYETPSTWTKEAKLRFLELPPDLQEYTISREKQRDREIHRSQREAGDLRRSLAAAQAEIADLKSKLEAESVRQADEDQIQAKLNCGTETNANS